MLEELSAIPRLPKLALV